MFVLVLIFITSAFIAFNSTPVLGDPIASIRQSSPNNRPIIGVLTEEISFYLKQHYSSDYTSYIAASYVKFIEGAGARVVPIWIGKNEDYYDDILNKINGVLLPGGSTYFNHSNGYADAANKIYKISKKMNKEGDYFPILGICLGMEVLTYVAANLVEHRKSCNSKNEALPLVFTPSYRKSRMFNNTPSDIINILQTYPVTANFHQFCVTKTALKNVGLSKQFRVLSLNTDPDTIEFISSLEHTSLPFYGLQFHPEKNMYEWAPKKNIPHDEKAIKAGRYFADFFVNEARKNSHSFGDKNEEAQKLIYNYPATYTGLKKSAFEQCYLFKDSDTYL